MINAFFTLDTLLIWIKHPMTWVGLTLKPGVGRWIGDAIALECGIWSTSPWVPIFHSVSGGFLIFFSHCPDCPNPIRNLMPISQPTLSLQVLLILIQFIWGNLFSYFWNLLKKVFTPLAITSFSTALLSSLLSLLLLCTICFLHNNLFQFLWLMPITPLSFLANEAFVYTPIDSFTWQIIILLTGSFIIYAKPSNLDNR